MESAGTLVVGVVLSILKQRAAPVVHPDVTMDVSTTAPAEPCTRQSGSLRRSASDVPTRLGSESATYVTSHRFSLGFTIAARTATPNLKLVTPGDARNESERK